MNEEQIRIRFLHWYAALTPDQQDLVIHWVLTALLDAAQPPTHTHTQQAQEAYIDATAAQLLADIELGGCDG